MMITPGQRSLPLSVHNRFVITFTNTDFSTSIGCVGSRLRARHRSRTTIVRVFAFLTSVDIRLRIRHFTLHTRFWVRHNTTDSRQQCSCCQRSATMFAVFLHCTAVLCVVVMSHPQPSLSGTGVLRVSTGTHRCVDPPRQSCGSTMRQLVRCVDCGCRA